jgi:hypothetical protein
MLHPTRRLDALGQMPFSGFTALLSIDLVLFPEWGTSFRVDGGPGVPDTWLATARHIHEDPVSPGWTAALDLVTWFIAGHEAFHAQGTCALTKPSFPETSGYADDVTWLQQEEFFCPNPPENVEVNADACGLRWLEAADAAGASQGLDSETRKVARATALLTLSALFSQGLRAPIQEGSRYQPTGYLYPHLRIALVHRALFRLNDGDFRLGLCADVLSGLWMDAQESAVCVNRAGDVLLVPERVKFPAFDVLSSVDVDMPSGPRACLDGTARLPARTPPVSPGAAVTVRVLAIEPLGNLDEDRLSRPVLASVQQELRKPRLHAALSACLPPTVSHRVFRLRYTRAGPLDAVRGIGEDAEKLCVRNVLAPFKFGGFFGSADGPEGAEPVYAIVLELRRRP